MSHRYQVHTFKFAVALATCSFCVLLAVVMACLGEWLALPILTVIFLLFGYVVFLYGSTVTVDAQGVQLGFCGIPRRRLTWAQIREVGVVGLKVFNNNEPKLTGNRYIYFSPRAMDEAERFKLALEWPPRDMPYLFYTKDRLQQIQALWTGPVKTYNAGNLFF